MRYGLSGEKPAVTTIRVRMLRTKDATLDGGATITHYQEGQEYDLPDWLAESFFRAGHADPAEAYEDKREAMDLAHGGIVQGGGPYLVGTGHREFYIPLDARPEATHSEAATAATEGQDDATGSPDEDHHQAPEPRQERRPRRPRRVHGE